jgi:hypothetical protein
MPTMTRQRPPISGLFYFMEVWKDIPGYDGIYQVSNLGNVKSLSREVKRKGIVLLNERLLKPGISIGYYCVSLSIDNKKETFNIHQLVAIAFLRHAPCGYKLVVDHINDNKLDNRLENLQIVTHRFNVYKTQGKYSSQYKGVSWDNSMKKWRAEIIINNKNNFLGRFNNEEEAHQVYQNKLKTL